jgi:outer membrane protein OmpA-like peptidoglycan-associated protein
MTRRTSNRLAALAAAALAGALAGCAAPAPEVVAEPPTPAIPEPPPVDFHSRPAETISLPLGPAPPKAGADGATAASRAEAAPPTQPQKADGVQPSASGPGSIQALAPTVAGNALAQVLQLGDAVLAAANALFASADPVQLGAARSAAGRLPLAVDPAVDGMTGFQTVATRTMQERVVKLVREQYPRYELKPFTTATLATHPLLLIGTVTPVDKDGKSQGARDALRICLALVDLQNGRVVSKGLARATSAGVDTTPTLFFADSPAWAPDAATQGYLKTCHEANPGDPINPTYLGRLTAAALVHDAVIAYEAGDYEQAYQVFNRLRRAPGGDQLRAHNGLYLASQKLGRRDDATRAFAHLVDFGLAQKQLGIKFQFRPGSVAFVEDPQVSGEYPLWLTVVSQVAERRSDCIEVSGRTSRSGPEPLNEQLSLMRAQYIKQRIDAAGETIGNRTRAVSGRESLKGLGGDDALDRRVEFRVLDCKARPS